jgi:hypothetical protein
MSTLPVPQPSPDPDIMAGVVKLTKDLRTAARNMSELDARFFVDRFYLTQSLRIRCEAQINAAPSEPNEMLLYLAKQYRTLEQHMKNALNQFAQSRDEGLWLMAQMGIGPVIAAGIMSNINWRTALTPAKIWSFAGVSPTMVWKKGQKRPFNARLRVLQWKAGKSFVLQSKKPDSYYGQLYVTRKAYEEANNQNRVYAPQAAKILEEKNIGHDTDAYAYYSQGLLPPAHIDARARRYVAKRLLSHYWEVLWAIYRGDQPKPKSYAVEHLGHVDADPPPFWPLTPKTRNVATSEEKATEE